MLNKILLRKIKFPLSLRGAFSFCHSRESGNPSSLSLRGAKQRSNLNGFSLIELMVALAILGIAALGIFQAYTIGFQAMADSKDRTVATNIAQKKLEEVKNSVSVLYPYYNIGYQELNGKTFTIIVATNSKEENLEQVIVTVSWKNRNEIEKNVQLETLVYDLKIKYNVPGPDVGQIDLSANTTALTCCVTSETSNITAELFNTSIPKERVPSGTPVSFQVNNGSVNPEFTVTDASGKAYTTLTINNTNLSIVTATSGLASDQLEVTCTPKANKIDLSANPSAILPDSSSTITATVTDTCGEIISGELNQVDVKFKTDEGFFNGSESIKEITKTTVNGIATVNLSMKSSGVTATVIGTVTPAEGTPFSDTTTVLCTDYSITVTAKPTSITPVGSSTITAILTQSGGSPAVGETISFTTDNKGTLSASTAITDLEGKATVSLSSLVGGDIATITATYTYNIPNSGSISDDTTVKCTEYIIKIKAEPNKIIPDGHSTITATLTNYLGGPAPDKLVKFYTTKGKLKDASMYTNSSGIATTTLTLSNVNAGEVANVSTTFGYTSDSVPVECIEFILVLTAVPTSITPGGSSEITATLTNYSGIPQSSETINFTTDYGSFTETGGTATTDASGKAIVHLTLNTSGTTAIVTATYGAAKATVSVRCLGTFIRLNDPPNITIYNNNIYVRFDLYLHGGPLLINKVKIEWNTISGSPSRYRNIWIEVPPTGYRTEIFSGNFFNNSLSVNLNQNYTILANRSFRIVIHFNDSIRDRHIIFTLNPDDPHAENYQVEFYTPN